MRLGTAALRANRYTAVAFVLSSIWPLVASLPDPSPVNGGSIAASNLMKCTLFDPPDMKTSLMQCKDVCGETVAKSIAAGETSSVTCFATGEIKWETAGMKNPHQYKDMDLVHLLDKEKNTTIGMGS